MDKRILGLIVDSQLVASSLNHAIVTTKLASMATLINNQLDEIENSLNLQLLQSFNVIEHLLILQYKLLSSFCFKFMHLLFIKIYTKITPKLLRSI